ncbi:hypothetical protein LXL04_002899 [Taraxacum kok-saghyz]
MRSETTETTGGGSQEIGENNKDRRKPTQNWSLITPRQAAKRKMASREEAEQYGEDDEERNGRESEEKA